MAFTYTITGTKDLGAAKLIYGTWLLDSGTATGSITFGGTLGGTQEPTMQVIDSTCISSTSSTTMTAHKVIPAGVMTLTSAANDAGYFSVTVA